MLLKDVNISFIRRALEYYKLDLDNDSHPNFIRFLYFHYNSFKGSPDKWLDRVETIFENVNSYVENETPTNMIIKVKNWINEKKKELKKNQQVSLSDELKRDKILDTIAPINESKINSKK